MKFKIENSVGVFTLITELVTAKEMCLFDRVTHEHSEYDTNYSDFKENNNIQCSSPKYDFVDDNVIASIVFWNVKNFQEEHAGKVQKFIQKTMNK